MSLSINPQAPYSATVPQKRYVPSNSLARIVTVLLIIDAVLSFLSALISAVELILPGQLFGDEETTDPLTLILALLVLGIGLLTIFIFIATVVLFLMWLYRTHENLSAFGVDKGHLQYSSGWAVGSFFIPFVSLVVPYRAIKELWRKSTPNFSTMFSELSPPGFFPLWWGFWLASNISDRIYFRMSWGETVTSDMTATVGVISGVLGMLAAFLAVKVVREIERQQTESSKMIPGISSFAHPPPPPEFYPPVSGSTPTSGYSS